LWVWVVIGLTSFVTAIILLLCVPVDAVLTLDASAERHFRLRLVWLFGLVRHEFGPERRKPKARQPIAKRKRRIRFRTIWRIFRVKGLLTKIKNLARDVLSRIKIKEIAVNLRLGLDDPADIGLAFAVIGAVKPFMKLPRQYELTIQPSFSAQPFFQGYVRGVLRLQPIRLVMPICRFVFSPAMFRVLRVLVSSRRASKSPD
jgi:hypothetical protein